MARLPIPGGDEGTWGDILNQFLKVEHKKDGTLKKAGDISKAKSDASQALADAASAQSTADAAYTKPSDGIPRADLTSGVQSSLARADARDAVSLRGRPLQTTAPVDGQSLVWSSANNRWESSIPSVASTVTFPRFDYTTVNIPAGATHTESIDFPASSSPVLIRQIRLETTEPGAIYDLKILRQADFSPTGLSTNLAFWVKSVQGNFMREFVWDYEDEDATDKLHIWIQNTSVQDTTVRILLNNRRVQ